jgi:predicted glycogen debranching enzyme
MNRKLRGLRPPQSPHSSPQPESAAAEAVIEPEWLVTNGLGGYASGTVSGVVTRRYHGLLIASLPAPIGRTVMLSQLSETVQLPGGRVIDLNADRLVEFRLEFGLPVWTYEIEGVTINKRVLMPHGHNTVHVIYNLAEAPGSFRLQLRAAVHFRSHEAPVSQPVVHPYKLVVTGDRYEVSAEESLPPLGMMLQGEDTTFTVDGQRLVEVMYRTEQSRGYESTGELWSPGFFAASLDRDHAVALVASVEPWESITGVPPHTAFEIETLRRAHLVQLAGAAAHDQIAAELVLAADQFIITPAGRAEEAARAAAAGDVARTIIAGYHWFTDWGRDTMISLEGLTLVTGRQREAAAILKTFAQHVRDGLIPNMFPDGATEGLYHTADATLWFFHAVDRYLTYTSDTRMRDELLPIMREIIEHHQRGTRYGIHVDNADGLLAEGADGYQLTWMDAKCDGWVVTPRRGKPVEINALWYNALRVLEKRLGEAGDGEAARAIAEQAQRARVSFNKRFWYDAGGYLYDVVDGPDGDDSACRPNQVFAISLPNPVLDETRWGPVMDVVEKKLLTPVGLRSLAPDHRDYQRTYHGDLRTRDGAYHQGTVWAWLIGPFIDAWLKLHPDRTLDARRYLDGLVSHMDDFGVGTIAEIFDAEPPFAARGCIAQAWSVAEVLRTWQLTAGS